MASRMEAISALTEPAALPGSHTAWQERLELVRLAARTEALYRSGVRVFAAADYDSLIDTVLDHLMSIMKVDIGAIFLADETYNRPTCRAIRTPEGESRYSPKDRISTSFSCVVSRRRRVVQSIMPDSLVRRFSGALPEAGEAQVLLGAPIIPNGEPLGVLIAGRRQPLPFPCEHRDILQALADQTALALAKLRALDVAVEEGRRAQDLVSITSHELRTPLTALQGFSELLLSRKVDANVQKSWLALINKESVRLSALVGELLDLSRIESGRLSLSLSVVNIGELLEDVANLWSRHDGGRRHFHIRLAPDLSGPVADVSKIRQVVSNLVSNAVKYSPEEAPVGLEAAGHCLANPSTRHLGYGGSPPTRRGRCPASAAGGQTAARLGASASGGGVSIVVRDEGIGLPPDDLERVFQPFYRVTSAEAREPAGAGLGLAIARRLVEWHGGQVWVESKLGEGSNFGFCLPPTPPANPSPPKGTFSEV